MKHTLYNILLWLCMVLMAAACDDNNDSDYVPGNATADGCMGVYFDSSNSAEAVFQPGERTTMDITLSRRVTTEAADVPLVCKQASEGLNIPAKASFAAGQKQTSVTITFGDLEPKKKYSFQLAVDEKYADHYAAQDGSATFSGFVMAAEWQVYSDNVTMTWMVKGVTYTWKTRLEQLGDINRYRFADFLGSGVDMVFFTGTSSVYEGYKRIEPFTNYEDYNDGYVDAFYLYDAENDVYPEWMVGDTKVTSLCIMREYVGYGDYSYISLTKRGGSFGTWYAGYDDGTYEEYNYINFTWPMNSVLK